MQLRPSPDPRSIRQAGNALFLILIAVALFAALSYAVTSSRGGGSISREQALLDVGQMMQYAALVEQTVNRLGLNGCTISLDTGNTLNFQSASWGSAANQSQYDNDILNDEAPPDDKSCDVFDPEGGSIVWQQPPASIRAATGGQYAFVSYMMVAGVGTHGGGQASNELTLVAKITEEACLAVNRMAGVQGMPTSSIYWASFPPGAAYAFKGDYHAAPTSLGAGSSVLLAGKRSGCWERITTGGHWFFYHVLVAR